MKFAIPLLMAACAFAQIEQPRIGVMLNLDGAARPLYGIHASATLGNPVVNGAISLACSSLCLIKTASSIVSSSGSVAAPPGAAMFAFSSDSALVFFPRVHRFARWRNDRLQPIPLDIAGEILAIGVDSFITRRPGGVWIVNSLDQPIDSLPFETRAALLLDSGVLYATADELILRRPDRSQQVFPISGVISLSPIGVNYIQAHTRDANYALRVDPGHERSFLLPEPE